MWYDENKNCIFKNNKEDEDLEYEIRKDKKSMVKENNKDHYSEIVEGM